MTEGVTNTVVLSYEITVTTPFVDMADRIIRRQLGNDSRITKVENIGDTGWCAWCEEAESPKYLAHEGHDDECPFKDVSEPQPDRR
jgi:hypothetical protein